MIVRTAWAQDGPPTGAMTWRYPAIADEEFPTAAINTALAGIYNHESEALNHPYLFIVRDASHDIIGIVITDPEEVHLDQPDINALYFATIDPNVKPAPRCNIEGDTWAIPWRLPTGYTFPVDPLNHILAALHDLEARPFIYPVYDRPNAAEGDAELRQVGLLISGRRDLPGDASENWRTLRQDYSTIFSDDELHPTEAPWGQKEWDLE